MNTNDPLQLLQKGFHVTLGATSTLIESVQDPLKREQNLAQLRLDFNQLTEIWAEKGQVTEQEARGFVDQLLSKNNSENQTSSSTAAPANRPESSWTSSANGATNIQQELVELKDQLAELRTELEQERQKPSS